VGVLTERNYQREAREAVCHALSTSYDNPAVVIPTGGGKSFVIAECVRRWKERCPKFRVCIVAHRKELVDQNAKELIGIAPDCDVGIYSAGLGRHDTDHTVTFAGIDSVYSHADEFFFDLIIVDEAHRIPVKGEGKYRTFIAESREVNPRLRVVGFTATPFRLDSGPIVGEDFILNRICYEAKTTDLIAEGFLCRLDSMVGDPPNLEGIRKSHGDYESKTLSDRMCEPELVANTVTSALEILGARNRRKCIWFCVDVVHCTTVADELKRRGESAEMIVGATPGGTRDALVANFKAGEFRHLLNVGVFTEGFNVKDVDAVVLLRPTLSKSLYWQMVGRGLRIHPDKDYCAVLDFAHLIEEHGPLSDGKARDVGRYECKTCGHWYSKVFDECPKCKTPRVQDPPPEEKKEPEGNYARRMHDDRAANADILGTRPTAHAVNDLFVGIHEKEGKPKSLRLTWRCGLKCFSEWLCLWHGGFAAEKAKKRLEELTGWKDMAGMFGEPSKALCDSVQYYAKSRVASIEVLQSGKYPEITKHMMKEGI